MNLKKNHLKKTNKKNLSKQIFIILIILITSLSFLLINVSERPIIVIPFFLYNLPIWRYSLSIQPLIKIMLGLKLKQRLSNSWKVWGLHTPWTPWLMNGTLNNRWVVFLNTTWTSTFGNVAKYFRQLEK